MRSGGMGYAVGPDLSALRAKEPDYWLKNILDPNAVIEPRFVAYAIETRDDRSLSGVIKTETASSLTIVSGNGRHRKHSSFRHQIDPRLEPFVNARRPGSGHEPPGHGRSVGLRHSSQSRKTICRKRACRGHTRAGKVLLLPAARAEILGGNIAFETPFKNIGMWHGSEDHVAWTMQVNQPVPMTYTSITPARMVPPGTRFASTSAVCSITGRSREHRSRLEPIRANQNRIRAT